MESDPNDNINKHSIGDEVIVFDMKKMEQR
jgi:hypothetical protein